MKKSTIKKLLRHKINEWLSSISDEHVVKAIKQDVLVTGGAIASGFLGEKINDYDIYFKTYETTLLVAKYYVEVFNRDFKVEGVQYTPEVQEVIRKNSKGEDERRILIYMKSAGVASESQTSYGYYELQPEARQEAFFDSLKEIEFSAVEGTEFEKAEALKELLKGKEKFRPLFLSENAISLSGKMQVVIRFFGSPEEIHRNFDFVHAQGVYDYATDDLTIPAEALESLLTKSLVYRGSLYPVASIFRLRKFIKRGWSITAGQMLKIIFQISQLKLDDPEVLREQLIGVDQAYMSQLMSAIEAADQRVDAAYLAKLIDTIFEE